MNDELTEPTAPEGLGKTTPAEPAAARTPSEQASNRSRRLLRLVLGIALVLALVAVSGFVWVRYTETPQYAVAQLTKAARDKDWAGVQKYIDFDAVADNLLSSVTLSGTSAGGTGSGSLGAKMSKSMKPVFVKQLKEGMKSSVEGDAEKVANGLPGVLSAKNPKVVKSAGSESLVTVQVPKDGGGTQELKLKMKRVGDTWRITAFGSAAEQIGQPATK